MPRFVDLCPDHSLFCEICPVSCLETTPVSLYPLGEAFGPVVRAKINVRFLGVGIMESVQAVQVVQEDVTVIAKKKAVQRRALEGTIAKGQLAYGQISLAVEEIIRGELFRPEFKTMSAYFWNKFSMSQQDLTRHIRAAQILLSLQEANFSKEQMPVNGGQLRELAAIAITGKNVDHALLQQLWRAVLSADKPITAGLISETYRAMKAAPSGPVVQSADAIPNVLGVEQSTPTAIEKPVGQSKGSQMSAAVILKTDLQGEWGSAFDFEGSPFASLGEGVYQFKVTGDSNQSLLQQLASWERVNTVRLVSITFE